MTMLPPKRLRILHFAYDHPDNPWCGGGGARRTWAVNTILAQRHDITVYCGAFPKAKPLEIPFKLRFLGRAKNYKESRLKFISGSLTVDSRPYDLIVEDFSAFSPSFVRCRNRPQVTIAHYYLGIKALRYRPVLGLIAIMSERLLLRRRKHTILVSDHLRHALQPGTRRTVIGPGVDIPTSLPTATEDYVLFLGRLDIAIKGIDILIEAWSKLSANERVLPLYIAGGGDQAKVRTLINTTGARDIHFLGRLDHKKALATIQRAAFLCLPSRMEGCGLVLYEALALGKPVIASSIPSFNALISHGVSGLLVPSEDPGALAREIGTLLTDSNLRAKLARGAIEIGEKFRWNEVAEAQEGFYRETMAGRGAC